MSTSCPSILCNIINTLCTLVHTSPLEVQLYMSIEQYGINTCHLDSNTVRSSHYASLLYLRIRNTIMATRMNGLCQPAPFAASSARASNAWSAWKTAFEYYISASQITDDAVKRATLLHCVGPDVQQLFATLDNTGTTYDTALKALTNHFEPQKNVAFERHLFRQCVQHSGESVDEYYLRLRTLSATCAFGDQKDDHIRDQFIDKCTSKPLRRRLLRETNLTLKDLLSIARAAEAADSQASSIESSNSSPSLSINDVRAREPPPPPAAWRGQPPPQQPAAWRGQPGPRTPSHYDRRPPPRQGNQRVQGNYNRRDSYGMPAPSQRDQQCTNCGIDGHQWRDPQCPAQGQECRICHKRGHYARVCRSSNIHYIINDTRDCQHVSHDESATGRGDEYDEYLFTVGHSRPQTRVQVANVGIDMLIDSGASVNVIDSSTHDRMRGQSPTASDLRLNPSHVRLFPYGATSPLPVKGEFNARISCSTGASTTARFVVVAGKSGCLLSRAT